MPVLPETQERSAGGYFSAPGIFYKVESGAVDYTATPVTLPNGEQAQFARGLIADADGTVTITPPGGASPVVVPVIGGQVLPLYFEAITALTGPTSVIAIF
ncbi:MAG: hypothetical protein D6816_17065 [Bacteroidetes bacterium]|nr:MAG: hypothetical protein D6816_17065 [Bacteroidota bacterium]